MMESISPYNVTLSLPWATGAWDFQSIPGLAKFAKEVARQAAMIGYLNAFLMYTLASAFAMVIVMTVRRRKPALPQ